ncbi:DNA polymerase III subunit epsilon [Candidatus Nasuia deltocephalinicola]|uniref:DNA-directed DNA polymerase n=1 Tax=Candidatus Nasuia deltocephalincola TaxID=1160784 RepID=A0A975A363_9PROT|nr:DNA polymerase III subunit epsilon [Candidatus Nasuia deltocephalinicola]
MNKIFLDIETTGLNPLKGDKIIEISCLKLINFKKLYFHHYLNPEKKISIGAYNIHGIDDSFLKNKKKFKDILFQFLNFIKNSKIIIHNAKFDLTFINSELNYLNFKNLNNYCYKIIDTLKISRNFYKKKNSLENICKRFNIDYSKRIKHSAFIDSYLLYKIYFKLILKIKKIKIINLKFKNKEKYFSNSNNVFKKSNKKESKLNNFFLKII